MAKFLTALLVSIMSVALVGGTLTAQSKKSDKKTESTEKELKGTAMCAKCELKDKDFPKCQTVLIVKEDGKEVKYYFDKDSEKKYHSDYCKGKTEITVKGKVTEKDGKKWLEVTSAPKKA
jgi:hypothetical protein